MKKEYTYPLEIIDKSLVSEILNEKEILNMHDEPWYGRTYGVCIGKIYEDGKKVSLIKKDTKYGSTEYFDTYLKSGKLKKQTVRLPEKLCDKYYVMYKVKDADKPTVMDYMFDPALNTEYRFVYEILLILDEGFSRYITREIKTKGSCATSMMDDLENIGDVFLEWAEEGKNGFCFAYEDRELNVAFYDEFGSETYCWFNGIQDLVQKINSVRIIEMESKIIEI